MLLVLIGSIEGDVFLNFGTTNDRTISRSHAVIIVEPLENVTIVIIIFPFIAIIKLNQLMSCKTTITSRPAFKIRDTSTVGSYVNEERLEKNVPSVLIDGDIIRFGHSARFKLVVP